MNAKTNEPRALSFEEACARYVHRYTGTHIPAWARKRAPNGLFYAPQYRDCREWYENTAFPGEPAHIDYPRGVRYCYSVNPSWPLGQWLSAPINH